MSFCYFLLPFTRLFVEKTYQYNRVLKNRRVSIYHIRKYAIKSLVPGRNNSASSTHSGSSSLTTFITVVRFVFTPSLFRICHIFRYTRKVHEKPGIWVCRTLTDKFYVHSFKQQQHRNLINTKR